MTGLTRRPSSLAQAHLETICLKCLSKDPQNRLRPSDGTVRWHLRHVYNKLHVRSRMEAALKFRSAKAV